MASRASKKRRQHKYGMFSVPQHRARLGDFVIWVHIAESGYKDGYTIRGDKQLPQEIKDAVLLWITNDQYAQMDLQTYLNKILNRLEYI